MTDKIITRGYVRWEDENGVHKEPLYKHPDMLAKASPEEQLRAEEARRLNEAAAAAQKAEQTREVDDTKATLERLQAAPADILTASQLASTVGTETPAPASAAQEPAPHDATSDHIPELTH